MASAVYLIPAHAPAEPISLAIRGAFRGAPEPKTLTALSGTSIAAGAAVSIALAWTAVATSVAIAAGTSTGQRTYIRVRSIPKAGLTITGPGLSRVVKRYESLLTFEWSGTAWIEIV